MSSLYHISNYNQHYRYQRLALSLNPSLFKIIVFFTLLTTSAPINADINIYSARKEHLIRPILNHFTEKTSIQTRLLTGKADALLERIKSESNNSPADILITTDVARLHKAKQLNLLATVNSQHLNRLIPAKYRDSDNQWFGLSLRSRIILVAKDRVKIKQLNYESLAMPEWKNRICIRSSNNVYNQSLVASLIHHNGQADTLQWIKGLVSNFARQPTGGDRDQILLSASGACDVAVVNTYYYAIMLNSDDVNQRKAAQQMRLIWPNQNNYGAHINISGAGILKTSQNKALAQQLLEYLANKEAQAIYSNKNFEFPVHQAVKPAPMLEQWGKFKADATNLNQIGELNIRAVKLMNQGGWL